VHHLRCQIPQNRMLMERKKILVSTGCVTVDVCFNTYKSFFLSTVNVSEWVRTPVLCSVIWLPWYHNGWACHTWGRCLPDRIPLCLMGVDQQIVPWVRKREKKTRRKRKKNKKKFFGLLFTIFNLRQGSHFSLDFAHIQTIKADLKVTSCVDRFLESIY
jgi:hypothetical protein